jgi:hypothetical protein
MEKTWKPTTAGILNIIAGSMGLGGGGLALWLRGTLATIDWGGWSGKWAWWGHGIWRVEILRLLQEAGLLPTAIIIGSIVSLVFGTIALAGGIHAIKRRRWGLALAGSILAIPISGGLGVLALIFVSIGKKEFA